MDIDDAQVPGDRLAQREQLEARVVDAQVVRIDRMVASDDVARGGDVLAIEGGDGPSHLIQDQAAHLQHEQAQPGELAVVAADGVAFAAFAHGSPHPKRR
jgi:hypothetical protein